MTKTLDDLLTQNAVLNARVEALVEAATSLRDYLCPFRATGRMMPEAKARLDAVDTALAALKGGA